jgi:hypothetical protein
MNQIEMTSEMLREDFHDLLDRYRENETLLVEELSAYISSQIAQSIRCYKEQLLVLQDDEVLQDDIFWGEVYSEYKK